MLKMSQKKVPVKTAEGALEIKTRLLGLAPRIRTALLLVDGVRSAAELERLMQAAGVTPGALQLLLDKGLIRFPEDDRQESVPAPTIGQIIPDEKPPLSLVPITIQPEVFEPTLVLAPTTSSHTLSAPEQSLVEPSEHTIGKSAEQSAEQPTKNAVEKTPSGNETATARPLGTPPATSPKTPGPATPNPLEVVTLLEIETILGIATELEVETILAVATKLEATPTQALAPDTVVKAPQNEEIRLPPLAQAQRAFRVAAAAQKKVIPASILQLNLMVARAHLANALDQYMEIDGYLLKQKVVGCESRAELENLFGLVESGLAQRMEKAAAARIMGIARAVLER
jgi:hypothetical protein